MASSTVGFLHGVKPRGIRLDFCEGLTDWRKEKALDQLREHKITVRRAAEIADVTYVEMLSLAAEEGIDIGYTTDELERDLGRI